MAGQSNRRTTMIADYRNDRNICWMLAQAKPHKAEETAQVCEIIADRAYLYRATHVIVPINEIFPALRKYLGAYGITATMADHY
jgi:hypothetical protein